MFFEVIWQKAKTSTPTERLTLILVATSTQRTHTPQINTSGVAIEIRRFQTVNRIFRDGF